MPIVIVNFKTYERGTGEKAITLAKQCHARGAFVAAQASDIYRIAQEGVRVYAQHVDPVEYGKHTGATTPMAIKQAGASGTLLNHSERRVSKDHIQAAVKQCQELGLEVVLCAESVDEAKEFLHYGADYLAVEIPELIGGDLSIVSARPGIVKEAVEALGDNVILGAGVSSGQDLKVVVDEGGAGILPSSAIVQKAESPENALDELYSLLT